MDSPCGKNIKAYGTLYTTHPHIFAPSKDKGHSIKRSGWIVVVEEATP